MDEADQSAGLEELALKFSRDHRKETPRHRKTCLICPDKAQDNSAFCSKECRDDWQSEQDSNKRNGR